MATKLCFKSPCSMPSLIQYLLRKTTLDIIMRLDVQVNNTCIFTDTIGRVNLSTIYLVIKWNKVFYYKLNRSRITLVKWQQLLFILSVKLRISSIMSIKLQISSIMLVQVQTTFIHKFGQVTNIFYNVGENPWHIKVCCTFSV